MKNTKYLHPNEDTNKQASFQLSIPFYGSEPEPPQKKGAEAAKIGRLCNPVGHNKSFGIVGNQVYMNHNLDLVTIKSGKKLRSVIQGFQRPNQVSDGRLFLPPGD